MTASAMTTTPAGTAVPDSRAARAATALAGATMFALLDISRILFPSIAFIFGRAGTTPAAEMGLFSLVVFAMAAAAARLAAVNSTFTTPIFLVLTIIARVVLIAMPGGVVQMVASAGGLIAVVGLLGALAASDLPLREAGRGLALGLFLSTTLHVMLATQDSIWIGGLLGWLVTVTLVGTLGYSWLLVRPSNNLPPVRSTIPWLMVGPILAFHGIAASTPAALRAAMGESRVLPAVLLVTASGAGYLVARLLTSSFARESGGVMVMPPAVLTAVLLIAGDRTAIAAAASLLSAFVATLTFGVTGEAEDDVLASRARRGSAPGLGMLFTFIVVFGYYSSYELKIGFPRGLLPASSAVLIGLVLFRLRCNTRPDPKPGRDDILTLAFVPFVVFFVVLAANVQLLPVPRDASLQNLRVMTWNVHMGFDNDGKFNPNVIADFIASDAPDVLVLNEVDRGWLLSGGHDLLGVLSQNLQLEYSFGLAGDAVWGNAILSRFPIEKVQVTQLLGDAPMHRSMMSAEIVVGADRLGVVATQLHHLEEDEDKAIRLVQAQQLAEAAKEVQLRGIPVLIMGDFSSVPGSGPLAQLHAFTNLVSLASGRPDTPTFPSTGPFLQYDHILGTPGLTATDLHVPMTSASDHLPVALTIHVN